MIIRNENSKYEFFHLSFQEYFCARRLYRHDETKEVLKYFKDPWWALTLELYAGIRGDISNLYFKIKKMAKMSTSELLLISKCINEAKYTEKRIKELFVDDVITIISDMEEIHDEYIKMLSNMGDLFIKNIKKAENRLGKKRLHIIFRVLSEIRTDSAFNKLTCL